MGWEVKMKRSNFLRSRKAALFVLILALPLSGEEPNLFWFSAGMGVCTLGDLGFGGSALASVPIQRTVLSLRGTMNSESFFGDEFGDAAVTFGRAIQSHGGHLSLACGPAVVFGSRCSGLFGTRRTVAPTLGAALALQAFTSLGAHIGVGGYAYADLNGEQPFAGLTLNLFVGRLR